MIWKDQCSCQNLSLSLHFIYNLSLGLYLTFYIKHFQTFKQQNAPRCLIFWMVIIIFFVFLLDDEASLVIFTVMFKYFFFNYHQPSWHRVSAFFEFSECYVFFLPHVKTWKICCMATGMLTIVLICIYDRCGKISAGMCLHFSSVSTYWASTIYSASEIGIVKESKCV